MSVPTLDAVSNSGLQTGSSYSFSHTCSGSNRHLLVFVSRFGGSTVSSITYNGVSLTFQQSADYGSGALEVWGLSNPDTGTHNVVVTLAAAQDSIAGALSFNSVHQSSPYNSAIGSNTGTSGDITTFGFVLGLPVVGVNAYDSSISAVDVGLNPVERINVGTASGSLGVASHDHVTSSSASNFKWTNDANTAWAITGVNLRDSPGGYLTASAASLVLSGQAAGLLYGRKLAASPASLTLTGIKTKATLQVDKAALALSAQSHSILHKWKLPVDATALLLTAEQHGLVRGKGMATSAGGLTIAGGSASFVYGKHITASPASLVLAGEVTLRRGLKLVASPASLVLNGTVANLKYNLNNLIAGPASMVLSGLDTGILRGYKFPVTKSTLVLVASDRTFTRTKPLVVDEASLVLAGIAATLKWNRVIRIGQPPYEISILGKNANLLKGYRIAASPAALTVLGTNNILAHGKYIEAVEPVITLTALDVPLRYGYRLTADKKDFVLEAKYALITKQGKLNAIAGALGLSGGVLTLKHGKGILASKATLVLTGGNHTIRPARKIGASALTLTLTSPSTSLIRVHTPLTASPLTLSITANDRTLTWRRVLTANPGQTLANAFTAGLRTGRKLSFAGATVTLVAQSHSFLLRRKITASSLPLVLTPKAATLLPAGNTFARELKGSLRSSFRYQGVVRNE